MSKATRTAIRKLKDGTGNYLLNQDLKARWGYTLLGREVYISENMPDAEAGKRAIIYGDFSGLAVKITENWEINILRERFAIQHALGVYAYLEMDSKIENAQKLTCLTMKAE
jgi:HK97 family phage major capsid protein